MAGGTKQADPSQLTLPQPQYLASSLSVASLGRHQTPQLLLPPPQPLRFALCASCPDGRMAKESSRRTFSSIILPLPSTKPQALPAAARILHRASSPPPFLLLFTWQQASAGTPVDYGSWAFVLARYRVTAHFYSCPLGIGLAGKGLSCMKFVTWRSWGPRPSLLCPPERPQVEHRRGKKSSVMTPTAFLSWRNRAHKDLGHIVDHRPIGDGASAAGLILLARWGACGIGQLVWPTEIG